jgi:hypothetical protein
MGTRGAFGFIKNGEEKVTYNHFDAYPDGLGSNVITFVKRFVDSLNEIYDRIELVDETQDPNEEQLEHCQQMGSIRSNVSTGTDWYSALRDAQSEGIIKYGEGLKYMCDGKSFLLDSLFCEWAYIINLDTSMVEFYRGFNRTGNNGGRYASQKAKEGGDYYGVQLLGEVPIEKFSSAEITSEENEEGDWVMTLKYNGGKLEFN